MKQNRIVWLVVAVSFVASASVADAQIFWRRSSTYSGPWASPPLVAWSSPYVMPLPAYGVLPPPLASYYNIYGRGYGAQAPRAYGAVVDASEPAPRTRDALYPAIPFGSAPDVLTIDRRCVRYEITVPYANATVLIDGVKTQQTGLKRVFATPPLKEDAQYTVTITAQWVDQAGETRTRQRTFTVVAGETVRHTFIE